MARYQLIDDYLDDVAFRLRWRPDRDAVIDELRDHLYASVEHRLSSETVGATRPGPDSTVSGGPSSDAAQHQTLAHFGAPGDIAMDFATNSTRGLAVPTPFTVSTGRLGPFVALGWLVAAALFAASDIVDNIWGRWEGPAQWTFMVATMILLPAALLTVVMIVALIRRHGGLGVVGHLATAVAALGAMASSVSWFVAGWASLVGLGALIVAGALLRRGLTPRLPTLFLGLSWPAAALVWIVLRVLEVGTPDQWNNYHVPVIAAICVGALGYAVALFGLGRWMSGEEAVSTETAMVMASAATAAPAGTSAQVPE